MSRRQRVRSEGLAIWHAFFYAVLSGFRFTQVLVAGEEGALSGAESSVISAASTAQVSDELPNAWRARMEMVESLRVSCVGSRYVTRNWLARLSLSGDFSGAPDSFSFPVRIEFAIGESGQMRFEYHQQEWSAEEQSMVPKVHVDVFDGTDRVSFFPEGIPDFPNASIGPGTASSVGRRAQLVPVRLLYVPLDPQIGVTPSGVITPTGDVMSIDGETAIEVQHADDEKDRIWVLPGREFIPVKLAEIRRGRVRREILISYSQIDDGRWRPKEWTDTRFDEEGNPVDVLTLTVAALDVNAPIAPELFRLNYPPGTWISDARTDETYILREDGSKRHVLAGEYDGTNYDAIVNSEPEWFRRDNNKSMLLLLANVVAVLSVAIMVLIRRHRRSKRWNANRE